MADNDPGEELLKILSSIPGAEVTMSGGGRIFLAGYQKNTDCDYSLSLRLNSDQSLTFSESFVYVERGDDPGRTYVYCLVVPADQQKAFLTLLWQKGGDGNRSSDMDTESPSHRFELMLDLLKALATAQQLAIPKIGERNLQRISGWLKEAGIPHTEPYLAF